MSQEQNIRIVTVTTPDDATSEQLARYLLEKRLVSCVNVLGGVRSLYRWKGEICDDAEQMLVMKTVEERIPELMEQIRTLHPYEVCEILVTDCVDGNPAYLDWVRAETRPPK